MQTLTCDHDLFSFRSVKHSGGKGETKNRSRYNSSTERLPRVHNRFGGMRDLANFCGDIRDGS